MVGGDDRFDDRVVEHCTLRSAHCDALPYKLTADIGERLAAHDALRLQQQRGDDADRVVAELAPGDGVDVGDDDGVRRGAGEEIDERLAKLAVRGFEEHRSALDNVAWKATLSGAI